MATTRKIFLWNTIMNLVAAPLRFTLNLLLASFLMPSDYGAMVIPAVIVGISTVLVDSGFKASLIQKNTLKSNHCSTIFFVNLFVSIALFVLFLLLSKPLELFFNIENLTVLIIVTSFSLVIRSISMVSEARMQIQGSYGRLIFIELISYVIAYLVTIYMARQGYGALSIAFLALVSAFFYTILLLAVDRFVPNIKLVSKKLFWIHWRMGKSLLGQGLLEVFSDKVDEVILGKFIGVSELGSYSKGREYSNTLGVIGSKFFARPWFSVMSKHSTNKPYFTEKFRLAYVGLIIVGSLLMSGYYYVGDFFIEFTLGAQWLPLADLFKYFILSTAMYYLVVFNKYTILALGKAKVNFTIEIIYSITRLSALALIFILFRNETNLIYFLIGLDVAAKCLMLIIQSYFFNRILNNKLAYFIILNTILLLVIFTFSIFNSNPFIYAAGVLFILFILMINFKGAILKRISTK